MGADVEIKKGFQKTKIGWIPKEWEAHKLKTIGRITSGGTPSREQSDYWNGDIPWVTTTNINFKTILKTDEYITDKGLENSSAKLFLPGTLLMAMYGQGKTRGKVAILGIKATTNQACAAITLDDTVHNSFIFYNLSNRYNEIRSYSNTGNQENLNGEIIKNIIVPLPPLPEQKKIAQILSTWDKAIEQSQNLIEQLKNRKKGLMQQLLTGKTRLKGFSGEWKEVKLGEVFEEIIQKNDGGIHEPLTISAKLGFVSQRAKFDRVIAGGSLDKYIQLRKNDFSYNKGNSKTYQMGCIYLLVEYESAVVPFVYISFRAIDSNVSKDFYKHWFGNHGLDRQLKAIITSGARGDGLLNVSKKDFFSLRIPLPVVEEQQAIARVLTTADNEIKAQENYLAQLQDQKKGLMQQLLTGQKRVKVV
jgi:type I restriction enzyme S subunit